MTLIQEDNKSNNYFIDINNKRDFTKNMIYGDLKTNIKPLDIKKSEVVAQVGFQWYF